MRSADNDDDDHCVADEGAEEDEQVGQGVDEDHVSGLLDGRVHGGLSSQQLIVVRQVGYVRQKYFLGNVW